jgi:hypothetical protein
MSLSCFVNCISLFIKTRYKIVLRNSEIQLTKKENQKKKHCIICFFVPSEKYKIDRQVAKFIFGKNPSFRIVEFTDMLKLLRPGYKPPKRKQISILLNKIYGELYAETRKTLQGIIVCRRMAGVISIMNL